MGKRKITSYLCVLLQIMWKKRHHCCLVVTGDTYPLKNGLFVIVFMLEKLSGVWGKNGIAKDQLGELEIMEKEKMLDQLSGWL